MVLSQLPGSMITDNRIFSHNFAVYGRLRWDTARKRAVFCRNTAIFHCFGKTSFISWFSVCVIFYKENININRLHSLLRTTCNKHECEDRLYIYTLLLNSRMEIPHTVITIQYETWKIMTTDTKTTILSIKIITSNLSTNRLDRSKTAFAVVSKFIVTGP